MNTHNTISKNLKHSELMKKLGDGLEFRTDIFDRNFNNFFYKTKHENNTLLHNLIVN